MIKVIQELAAVIPPPKAPIVTIDTHEKMTQMWSIFGTRLPEDYLQFNRTYGEGWFFSVTHRMSAGITVYGNARDMYSEWSLRHASLKRLHVLRLVKERYPKRVPLPLFCEPKGLLPWGKMYNHVDLCWRVHDDLVDNWPVVILRAAKGQYQEFPCGMAQFLTGIISGRMTSDLLPKGFPGTKGVGWSSQGHEETFSGPPLAAPQPPAAHEAPDDVKTAAE